MTGIPQTQSSRHILAWEVPTTVLQVVSVGSTLIRLTHRWRSSQMWWDDYIAFIPLFVDVLLIIVDWLAATIAVTSQSFLYSPWFGTFMYFTVVWISRVSLSLSIARIFPPRHTCRRFSFGLTLLFMVLYIPNVLMPIFECETSTSSSKWFRETLMDCVKDRPAPMAAVFTSLALDFVADILLIISPLAMLWRIKLPRQQRSLILTLFSTSILSLLASIAFCITWVLSARFGSSSRMVIRMVGQIQAAISLLVCNLLVVAMLFYRMSRKDPLTTNFNRHREAAAHALRSLAQEPTQQGEPSRKEGNSSNTRRGQDPESNTCWVSQLQQDSILANAISFTTIFDDSSGSRNTDSLMVDSSLYKISAGTPSLLYYAQSHSRCSSDSRIPRWSFPDSDDSTGDVPCSDS